MFEHMFSGCGSMNAFWAVRLVAFCQSNCVGNTALKKLIGLTVQKIVVGM